MSSNHVSHSQFDNNMENQSGERRIFKLVELEYTTRLHSMIVTVVASTGLTSFAFYSDCMQI